MGEDSINAPGNDAKHDVGAQADVTAGQQGKPNGETHSNAPMRETDTWKGLSAPEGQAAGGDKKGSKKKKWDSIWDHGIADWVVMACTVVLACAAVGQYWVTRSQLREMEATTKANAVAAKAAADAVSVAEKTLKQTVDSMQLDQRAWVGIKSVDVEPMVSERPFSLMLNITNTGKTIAKNVTHPGFIAIVDRISDDPSDIMRVLGYPTGADQTNSMTLFPDGEGGIPIETSISLSPEVIEGIRDGRRHVYIIGTIFYEDAFDEKHATRYFQRYIPRINKFGAVGSGIHNDAN